MKLLLIFHDMIFEYPDRKFSSSVVNEIHRKPDKVEDLY